MSSNKPRLTLESKRTLLEQSLQWIGSLKLCEDNDKNVPVFFSFIKLILINQSFLNTSRSARFDIYELYLDYSRVSIHFKSKYVRYFERIELSFERDYKLAKLLQPSKISLEFDDDEIGKKDLKELIEILEATNGEISIKDWSAIAPFDDVVNEFSSRIRRFSCDADFFENCDMPSSFDSLDELKVDGIQNADQFLKISKCKAKAFDLSLLNGLGSLDLSMPINNENFFNKTVKQVRLCIKNFDYATSQRFIEQVLQFFPSLVELEIHAIFHFGEYPKNQIPNVASDSYQYMRALKDRLFANGLKKIALKSMHKLRCIEKCNSEWINKTSNKPEFKNWECKLKYSKPGRYYSKRNYGAVDLKFSTEEGNCKFDIELKVMYQKEKSKDNLIEHDDN